MEKLGVNEIREKYLSFFESKGHLRMESSSLVPKNDNSLLLINSGMAPLKPFFTGQEIPPRKRVTTCQKCIRTGDIENVGKTARHGTFFEMLGNFSFGDYFKNEAIPWAWEFFTEVMKIPAERLYVSVYQDDDEAYDIWNKKIGLAPERIFRMGKEDNFWEHGTGPCGPCSEIYYDKGEKYGCGKPGCTVGCDCDRYMEIWNLVFTQFDKQEDGSYPRLENPNIDTGMGLERIATVMQDVDSIFDVDTIKMIRDAVCKIAGVEYNDDHKKDISIRVITDHIRSVTFMVSDGILPSNEGRGYVLRRLLRRAASHGKLLGIQKRFLADLCKVVIENSKGAYPQLEEKKELIFKVITNEEERFYNTLDQGMSILSEKIKSMKEKGGNKVLNGEDSFKMYDTYGFPLDLMKEILEEYGISVDEKAFLEQMNEQRIKGRTARKTTSYMGNEDDKLALSKLDPAMETEFTGYDNFAEKDAKVMAIIVNNEIVDTAEEGNEVQIVLDKTPFYAEMGGQVGDKGIIKTDGCVIEITDCVKFGANKHVHIGEVKSGELKSGETVTAEIDTEKRMAIARNHTTTHILQKVLREILGNHVEQKGSFVSETRLRFDFTHYEPISKEDIIKIEKAVNKHILDSLNVETKQMPIEEAKKIGAMALFDEKYGDIVRVVNIGDYSIEFCGGTHLKNSSQAGSFKILSESSISAGVRRIEALTGENTLQYHEENEFYFNQILRALKTTSGNIIGKINGLIEENKRLTRELESLKAKMSGGFVDDIISSKKTIDGIDVICAKTENMDMDSLSKLGDQIKAKLTDSVVLLGSASGGKVSLVAMASDGAVKKGIKAGDIVKTAAVICGGNGGGRPNMARAGAKDETKLDEAISKAFEAINTQLG